MRIFSAVLGLCLVLLQYRLWLSDQGVREIVRLQTEIAAQTAANQAQDERNRQLAAEVQDLKVGMGAIEERARSELGMIGSDETFYEVVTRATPAPPAPAAPEFTARNE
jgi:cell division protein FtsB